MNGTVRSIRVGKKYRIKDDGKGNSYHFFKIGAVVEVIGVDFDFSIGKTVYLCEGENRLGGRNIKTTVLLENLEEI